MSDIANWRKPWTADDLQRALRLANDDGLFPSEIAPLIGRSRCSVSQQLVRLPDYKKHSRGDYAKARGVKRK